MSFLNTKIVYKWTVVSLDALITSSTSVNNKIQIGAGTLKQLPLQNKGISLSFMLSKYLSENFKGQEN